MNVDPRIVVGVDGSAFSTTALRLAGRMAAGLNAPLAVVTSVGTSDFFLTSHLPEERTITTTELEETAKRLVDQSLERAFGSALPDGLTRTVKFGAPAKVLVDESRRASTSCRK